MLTCPTGNVELKTGLLARTVVDQAPFFNRFRFDVGSGEGAVKQGLRKF